MNERSLRGHLLELTVPNWDALIGAHPEFEDVIGPEIRQGGRKSRVDGRAIRRWVEQPQQHKGRLVPVVLRMVRVVVGGDSDGHIDWSMVARTDIEPTVRLFLSKVALADDHTINYEAPSRAVDDGTSSTAHEDRVLSEAEQDGAAPEERESTEEEALLELERAAQALAVRLEEAAQQIRLGRATGALDNPLEQWLDSRSHVLGLIELPDAETVGFAEMTTQHRARAERRAAELEAEARRLEAQAVAEEERRRWTAELEQFERMLPSASKLARPMLQQQIHELRAVLGLGCAGSAIGPESAAEGGSAAPAAGDQGEPGGPADREERDDLEPSGSADEPVGEVPAPEHSEHSEHAEQAQPELEQAAQARLESEPAEAPESAQAIGEPAVPDLAEQTVEREAASAERASIPVDVVVPSGPAGPPPGASHGADLEAELVALVAEGSFAAAYWLEVAARGETRTATALRVSAGAFTVGVEPAEVLVACTAEFEERDFGDAPDVAGLVAVAMARAGLAAGWMPLAEYSAALRVLHLPPEVFELLTAVEAAGRASYRYVPASAAGAAPTLDDVQERASALAVALAGAGLTYQRATRVLQHLSKPDEALGSALLVVERRRTGDGGRKELLEHLERLTDAKEVERLIDAADRHVTSVTSRQSIVATARAQLNSRFEQVAAVVRDALAVPDGPVDEADHERGDELRRLARAAATAEVPGLFGAAAGRLQRWILESAVDARPAAQSIPELLVRASLPLVDCARGDAGAPLVSRLDLGAVRGRLLSPPTVAQQLETYLARGDLQAAALLTASVPGGAEAFEQSSRNWMFEVEQRAGRLRDRLAKLPFVVRLDDAARAGLEGRILAGEKAHGDRFDVSTRELDAIEAELDRQQEDAAALLRSQLAEMRTPSDEDRQRFEGVLKAGDLTTADQFLHFLREGDELPPAETDETRLLGQFGQSWRRAASGSMPFDQLCAEFGGLQGARATQGVTAWLKLSTERGAALGQAVQGVLALIGLETLQAPAPEPERTRVGMQTFVARDARPVDGSIVPELGTRAKRFTVRIAPSQLSARELVEAIPKGRHGEANLTLYRGRLTGKDRTDLIDASRRTGTQVVVVDDLAVAFLAQLAPGSWKATQQIALPFSSYSHYRPYIAGDVPDEIFVGRQHERNAIASAEGGLFVYGGRQLGKSALLRRVQRDFDRIPGSVAIYIDLKARGIGEFNKPEHLWNVLLKELQQRGIASSLLSLATRETIPALMRQWLQEDDDRRILLLLDEADLFLEQEAAGQADGVRRALFPNVAVLKGLMDETGRRFKPVFAGLHQVQRFQNMSNSPLAHGGREMLIGPLHQAEARTLVVEPMAALGYRFADPDLVWRLVAVTNFQAGLVQIVCEALIEQMRQKPVATATEPPFVVDERAVEAVLRSPRVRDQISDRFQLTIRLEDRYFVIALVVASLCIADSFREWYDAVDIREYCQTYWLDGFDQSTLTVEQLRVYLGEMVGLGVLVKQSDPAGQERYTVRSPSIVQMLGRPPEQQLKDRAHTFELPREYNPRYARRAIGRNGRRSPLTEQDLAIVFRENLPDGVLVVAGTPALGIGRVGETLQEVSNDGTGNRLVEVTRDLDEALRRSTGVVADRRPIRVLDALDLDGAAVLHAVQVLVHAEQEAQRQKLVSERRVVLISASAADPIGRAVPTLTLRRWDDESLRGWNDLPYTGPEGREVLLHATGGWPALVEDAVLAPDPSSLRERLARFPEGPGVAADFLRDTGLTERDVARLQVWADLVGPDDYVDPGVIADILGEDMDGFVHVLRRLVRIGVAVERSEGTAIERLVHRAVQSTA